MNSDCDSLILKASSVDIAPTQITVPNRSGTYDITVEEKTVELREVIVKAKKIYSQGDTINYNVGSFLSQTDRSIVDVLKKMPGISVSDAGQVSYQGKPIKTCISRDLIFMKGHYGIATNNIDPNNIATVQVLENHQDIKALKGLRPEEQASINLRLKEGVKGVFNLIATLGGGYGEEGLWNNSAICHIFPSQQPIPRHLQGQQHRRRSVAGALFFRQRFFAHKQYLDNLLRRRLRVSTSVSIISTARTTPHSTTYIA